MTTRTGKKISDTLMVWNTQLVIILVLMPSICKSPFVLNFSWVCEQLKVDATSWNEWFGLVLKGCGKGMVLEAAGVRLKKKKSSNEERLAIDFCRESECDLGGHTVTCWCCMLPLKPYNCRLERNECWNDCPGWRGATRNNPWTTGNILKLGILLAK